MVWLFCSAFFHACIVSSVVLILKAVYFYGPFWRGLWCTNRSQNYQNSNSNVPASCVCGVSICFQVFSDNNRGQCIVNKHQRPTTRTCEYQNLMIIFLSGITRSLKQTSNHGTSRRFNLGAVLCNVAMTTEYVEARLIMIPVVEKQPNASRG